MLRRWAVKQDQLLPLLQEGSEEVCQVSGWVTSFPLLQEGSGEVIKEGKLQLGY